MLDRHEFRLSNWKAIQACLGDCVNLRVIATSMLSQPRGRDRSRHVATGRRCNLLDVSNMLLNGRSCDEIFFAELGFDPTRGEMLFCAISLNAARRAGDAGLGVEGEGVLNGKSKIAVAAGRDRSRRVDGFHGLMITRRPGDRRRLSPRESAIDCRKLQRL